MSDQASASSLAKKDRDTLLSMARAMGIKGVSRLKKAELAERIAGGGGAEPKSPSRNGAAPQESAQAARSETQDRTKDSGASQGGRPPGAETGASTTGDARATRSQGPDQRKGQTRSGASNATPKTPASHTGAQSFSFDPMADARSSQPSLSDDEVFAEADKAQQSRTSIRSKRPAAPVQSAGSNVNASGRSEADKDDRSQRQDSARSGGAQGSAPQNNTPQDSSGQKSGKDRDGQGGGQSGGRNQDSSGGDNRGSGNSNREASQRDNSQRDNSQRDNSQRKNRQRNSNNNTNANNQDNNRRNRRRGRNRDRDDEPQGDPVPIEGLLEVRDEGYGFLRSSGPLPGKSDAYVSASQIRKYGLRKGDYLTGATRPPGNTEKYPAMVEIHTVCGISADQAKNRPSFSDKTPLFPDQRLKMETGDPNRTAGRIIDLLAPIGKGQRGLIVSPPKAGKTTIMKEIVSAIEANNPEVHLIVLLVDERPEEVTDFRRHVKRGEVYASTFDRPPEQHIQVAELTIERAKRLVELGKDVVVILDGITRLSRAYNLGAPTSGRILSGGVDSAALYPPKKFFGAARNTEEGGSLTIMATALVETGSRMDEVIFEEFKGTGNMELKLDRRLAERRIYPAIDVSQSSTRHEELLFDRDALKQVWKLRRVLDALEDGAGLELLMDRLGSTKTNDEFLTEIAKAPSPTA